MILPQKPIIYIPKNLLINVCNTTSDDDSDETNDEETEVNE